MIGLSYILPCYNAGDFINDCLNSIYSQRLSEEEFEVICINDCSTDNTQNVIEQYRLKHTNLTLINQPRNMYSGIARNRGLDVAKGDYIWFVDSDDMIKPGAARSLFDEALKDNLDILYFNYNEISENGCPINSNSGEIFVPTNVTSGNDFVTKLFGSKLTKLSLLWCRIIKRDLIERHGIRFSDLYITQDAPFAWETLLRADRVKAISDRPYVYRRNANSITAKKPNARRSYTWSFLFPCEILNVRNRLASAIPDHIRKEFDRSVYFEVNQFPTRFLELDEEERVKFYDLLSNDKHSIKSLKAQMCLKVRVCFSGRHLGYNAFLALTSTMFK